VVLRWLKITDFLICYRNGSVVAGNLAKAECRRAQGRILKHNQRSYELSDWREVIREKAAIIFSKSPQIAANSAREIIRGEGTAFSGGIINTPASVYPKQPQTAMAWRCNMLTLEKHGADLTCLTRKDTIAQPTNPPYSIERLERP
jgi:alkylated DNA nucleotide flippase Atl1